LVSSAFTSACALALVGCRDEVSPPERLVDGSPATAPAVVLQGIESPQIVTRLRVLGSRRARRDPAAASCARTLGGAFSRSPVVGRVGVDGSSLTLVGASGRALLACDSTSTAPSREANVCGHSYGRLENGRLSDPRLDLLCPDRAGDTVAFAWVEPMRRTRFVAVRHSGYAEVFRVAARLPVRVTSRDVDLDHSTATFDVSEHDGGGRSLRHYTLQPSVSG
jgi:hypothetical protein